MNNDQDVQFRVPNSPVSKDKQMTKEQKKILEMRKMIFTLKEQLTVVLNSKPLRENIACTGSLFI